MNKVLILAVLIIGCASTALAGPFGTNMGDTKDKYSNLVKSDGINQNTYITGVVPKKHDDFIFYSLLFAPEYGLVKVSALSYPISGDGYGVKSRALFAKIKEQLCKKYGNEKNFYDYLHAGSIWKEDQFWSIGIRKNERTYSAFWELNDNEDKIKSIMLKIVSNGDANGISISYDYIDAKKYFDEKDKDDSGAL